MLCVQNRKKLVAVFEKSEETRRTRRFEFFLFLKRNATSAMNFLIQLKRNAIPQLRNGIFVPS